MAYRKLHGDLARPRTGSFSPARLTEELRSAAPPPEIIAPPTQVWGPLAIGRVLLDATVAQLNACCVILSPDYGERYEYKAASDFMIVYARRRFVGHNQLDKVLCAAYKRPDSVVTPSTATGSIFVPWRVRLHKKTASSGESLGVVAKLSITTSGLPHGSDATRLKDNTRRLYQERSYLADAWRPGKTFAPNADITVALGTFPNLDDARDPEALHIVNTIFEHPPRQEGCLELGSIISRPWQTIGNTYDSR